MIHYDTFSGQNLEDAFPVATVSTDINGAWDFQRAASLRQTDDTFAGYDVVQEPTPNNHINLYLDATGTPCRALGPQQLRCDMVPASPVLTSLDAAIFFLRMIGTGADSMDKGVKLPTKPTKTTYYIGGLYEVDSDGATRSYYSMGGQGLAMRSQSGASQSVVYLHGDHLGSVSMATDSSGNRVSKQDFDPWGKVRSSGKVDQTIRSAVEAAGQ